MPQIKAIVQTTQTVTNAITTVYGDPISMDGALTLGIACVVDVNTPVAKTFPASDVNVATDTITVASHGFTTGLKTQVGNPGTLPSGISAVTDYFVIVVTSSTFKLASSLVNALAGTAIDIMSQGSGTNTITPVALAGANVKLQKSNDGTNWVDEGSPTNITADAVIPLEKVDPTFLFMRLAFAVTAGSFSSSNVILVKGPN